MFSLLLGCCLPPTTPPLITWGDQPMWKEKYWHYRMEKTAPEELKIRDIVNELIDIGMLKKFVRVIGEGKEAIVLWGVNYDDLDVAIKIFKLYNSAHRELISKTSSYYRYEILEHFAKLEYHKQLHFYRSGIAVPEPLDCWGYAYSMRLIMHNSEPAKLLSQIPKSQIKSPESILEQAIAMLKRFFEINYVHGDFSPYNLLLGDDGLLICIDFLQSRHFKRTNIKDHSSKALTFNEALKVLCRDMRNLLNYSKKFRLSCPEQDILDYLINDTEE